MHTWRGDIFADKRPLIQSQVLCETLVTSVAQVLQRIVYKMNFYNKFLNSNTKKENTINKIIP